MSSKIALARLGRVERYIIQKGFGFTEGKHIGVDLISDYITNAVPKCNKNVLNLLENERFYSGFERPLGKESNDPVYHFLIEMLNIAGAFESHRSENQKDVYIFYSSRGLEMRNSSFSGVEKLISLIDGRNMKEKTYMRLSNFVEMASGNALNYIRVIQKFFDSIDEDGFIES